MKKAALLLLVFSILLSLSGCSRYYPKESDSFHYNYNNFSAKNFSLWLTEDACYGIQGGWSTVEYCAVTEHGIETIYTAESTTAKEVITYGNTLYMVDGLDGAGFWLHSYDMETETHTGLGSVSFLSTYFVVGNAMYYRQEYSADDQFLSPLWYYSMTDGSKVKIAESTLSAGVIDGVPAYIVQNENEFFIYLYDAQSGVSEQIGQFSCSISEDEGVDRYVNFTSEQVILSISQSYYGECRLVCYNFKTGELVEHVISKWVTSVIAYENYAFVVAVDNISWDLEWWQSTVYRISLKDGNLQKITKMRGEVETFVPSDEYVFLRSINKQRKIYRCDAYGKKSLAYSFGLFG